MSNMPVSSHITVIAVAPAAAEAAGVQPLPATDAASFATLLARQIEAGSAPLPGAVETGEPPLKAESGDVPALPAADPAALLQPITALPVAPVSVQPVPGPVGTGRPEDGPRVRVLTLGGPGGGVPGGTSASQAPGLPQTDAAPAKLADPPLPAAQDTGKEALPVARGPAAPEELPTTATNAAAPQSAPGPWHGQGTAPIRSETVPAATVQQPVGSPGWTGEFAQKVVWVSHQGQQFAQIQVTPPQLGPVEIHLALGQDQASMTFVSSHAPVREAIEAALPRLREMLAESGIQLGNVEVAAHSFGQGARQDGEPGSRPGPHAAATSLAPLPGVAPGGRIGQGRAGLVDVFA